MIKSHTSLQSNSGRPRSAQSVAGLPPVRPPGEQHRSGSVLHSQDVLPLNDVCAGSPVGLGLQSSQAPSPLTGHPPVKATSQGAASLNLHQLDGPDSEAWCQQGWQDVASLGWGLESPGCH